MLSNARACMISAPHVAIVPGLAVMLAVLGYKNQPGARALFEGEGGGEGIG